MNKCLYTCLALFLVLSADVFAKSNNFPEHLLQDDFEDGDYTNNPTWEVPRGSFEVVNGKLVSNVQPKGKNSDNASSEVVDSDDSIFESYSWEQLTNASPESASGDESPALIYTKTQLTNAFSIRMEHQFVNRTGKMVLGVYQVKRGKLGYRVVINPKKTVRLIRLGETLGRVVVAEEPFELENDDSTRINWSRFENGRHIVRIGGKKVLDIVDPYFKQPFDGFFILNRQGDQRIDRIVARGAR